MRSQPPLLRDDSGPLTAAILAAAQEAGEPARVQSESSSNGSFWRLAGRQEMLR